MSTKKLYDVCIAGGGIGGIALALRLRILNQKISIYLAEKDRSFSQRSQGYGLTLQQANKVLNDLNIKRQIQEVDTPNDAHYTYNKQGELLSVFGRFMFEKPPPETLEPPTGVEKAGKVTKVSASKLEKQRKWQKENQSRKQSKRYNFHVPRQKLREILLDELNRRDPSIVNWDRSVKDFDIREGGEIDITLADHNSNLTKISAKTLVGADGIFSSVRKIMFNKGLTDLENNELVNLKCLVILGMAPSDSKVCLRSTFQTMEGENRFFSMPFTVDPNVQFWQFSFPCEPEFGEKLRLPEHKELLRTEVKARLAGWHHPIPDLIDSTPLDMMTGTPVYDRDFSYGGNYAEKVILIGDAAHPMSPFKGQGANQALLDACELADVVLSQQQDFKSFIGKMNLRSQPKMDGSRLRVYQYHDPARQGELTESRGLSSDTAKVFRDNGIDFRSAEDGSVQEKVLAALRHQRE